MDYIESLQKARRRRKQVMAYRKQGWTYKRIGQKLGISTQRAWKVADEENASILEKSNAKSPGKTPC